MGQRENALKLITEAMADPAAAFETALSNEDSVAMAVVSILAPGTSADVAHARLRLFVAKYEDEVSAELLISIIGASEEAGQVDEDLAKAGESLLRELRDAANPLPLTILQAERVKQLVEGRELSSAQRALFLWWLNERAPKLGETVALRILGDPDEAFENQAQRAAIIIGRHADFTIRKELAHFVRRNLDPDPASTANTSFNVEAALYALNSFRGGEATDWNLVEELVMSIGRADIAIDNLLDGLIRRMPGSRFRALVERLVADGSEEWVARELLAVFIRVRTRKAASSAGGVWWPSTCLRVLALANWGEIDEDLFAEVLEQLHKTKDDDARLLIRERAAVACERATSTSRRHLPRIGVRTFIKLTLQGDIPIDDPYLHRALQTVDRETLYGEILGLGWKSVDRAKHLGGMVVQVDESLLPDLLREIVQASPSAAVAMMEGATYEELESIMDALLEAIGDSEAVLSPLCEGSEVAAAAMLDRWKTEASMSAFRALARTDLAEGRLESAPGFVRSYRELSHDDRTEVLQALGRTEDRVSVLLQVLADRTEPSRERRPGVEDLIVSLGMLREHAEAGQESPELLEAVATVCREATQPSVRRAAYEVVGACSPNASIIDLLLERRTGEASSGKPAVERALEEQADSLDKEAADETSPLRAVAAKELARIDPARAAVHARDLLLAENADHRRLAASILGEAGVESDAGLIESMANSEPHPEVRREMERTIRRLRIGDIAEAHERLGELAGVEDPNAWAALAPGDMYGGWEDALVVALDRVARAETDHHFGTAIDQLDEAAKGLLFRAIEVAGSAVGTSQANRAKAATNNLDYGSALRWQQMNERWTWVSFFASLHGLRTEHIAERGSLAPPIERTDEDLRTAYSFFKLGAGPCLGLLAAQAGAAST